MLLDKPVRGNQARLISGIVFHDAVIDAAGPGGTGTGTGTVPGQHLGGGPAVEFLIRAARTMTVRLKRLGWDPRQGAADT
jgi:hypothetical protein